MPKPVSKTWFETQGEKTNAKLDDIIGRLEALQASIDGNDTLRSRRTSPSKDGSKTKAEWQPIATAPYGEMILVFDKRGTDVAFRVADALGDHWKRCSSCKAMVVVFPTHWQPLPDPDPPQGLEQ